MTNYQEQYGLSNETMEVIRENIKKANKILVEMEKNPNPIKENCESKAIENYLNSL